jgi:hypothetical protein
MKYSNPITTGRSIIHQFSEDGNHIIGGKKWRNVDMTFHETPTNSDKRSFMFVIRYGNPEDREWQLNQFSMKEDDIKQFLDIVYETVYNPPKFKDKYSVGDKFIIKGIKVTKSELSCLKETNYINVEATISNLYNSIEECKSIKYYTLSFDGNSIIVQEDYLNKLKRIQKVIR